MTTNLANFTVTEKGYLVGVIDAGKAYFIVVIISGKKNNINFNSLPVSVQE
jgi:hypothetical protein